MGKGTFWEHLVLVLATLSHRTPLPNTGSAVSWSHKVGPGILYCWHLPSSWETGSPPHSNAGKSSPGGTRGLPAPARSHRPTSCAAIVPSPGG